MLGARARARARVHARAWRSRRAVSRRVSLAKRALLAGTANSADAAKLRGRSIRSRGTFNRFRAYRTPTAADVAGRRIDNRRARSRRRLLFRKSKLDTGFRFPFDRTRWFDSGRRGSSMNSRIEYRHDRVYSIRERISESIAVGRARRRVAASIAPPVFAVVERRNGPISRRTELLRHYRENVE